MTFAQNAYRIFEESVRNYHIDDDVDAPSRRPYADGTLEAVLYDKNHIDAVQWHLEDIIRDPNIDPVAALALKRRIDRSNQDRTDMVEELDTYFRNKFASVVTEPDATINTESPAWAFDRLSILALKIYHMEAEVAREDATPEHRAKCAAKLAVLKEQQADLTAAIDTLLDDMAAGRKFMKVYRQMKMYNDVDTNPVLYAQQK
ncbi:MAG: DUF4254 domain-containing protein [Bacteroidales bacterium]|nr:DUF4254 domain-containing protein [Bacteroidales bacterium]